MIEYHKIHRSVGNQREGRSVRNSQKFYLCNNVVASRHDTKDQSIIIPALTDKISYSSFSLWFDRQFSP